MKTVSVSASRDYDILIGPGLMDRCGGLVNAVHAPCAAAVVTDDRVDKICADRVAASLERAGFRAVKYVFPHGEDSKTLAVLGEILEFLARSGLTRSDLVVALGGGVAGDMAGFAAACYQRGLPFVQLPTTLLAAVDSSVGGKTAVNLAAGKNLAGAFYQPSLVLCDTEIIAALPEDIFRDGLAEAIKYGVIADAALFALLSAGDARSRLEEIVFRCVSIKARFVAEDEYDRGERMLLNFGHTAGHAIEKCSGYAISHGRAVAMGMVIAARAAEKWGLCDGDCLAPLMDALSKNGLPVACGFSPETLSEAARSDKKRGGGKITLVVPRRIGACYLRQTDMEGLDAFLRDGLEGQT